MADNFNVGTLGEMVARVGRYARERVNTDIAVDSVNDAIQSLWKSLSLATLSRFVSAEVSLTIPSGATTLPVITIPDPGPTQYANTSLFAGGAFPARTLSFAYAYLTDSGSSTLVSPEVAVNIPAGYLSRILPPPPVSGAIGWAAYCGDTGLLVGQNVAPLDFNQPWVETPAGPLPYPTGPYIPYVNSTGDNIVAIARLDIRNQNGTLTRQLQSDVTSSLFSDARCRLPSTSTYVRHAYDLVDGQRIEIAPAATVDLDASLFYIVRPRRLRYPTSILPYSGIDAQQFIGQQALADVLLSLNEDTLAAAWEAKAEKERQRLILSVLGEAWNTNTRVRRYM